MWFQALRAKDKRSDWSHTGFFLDGLNVFETTPGKTMARDFARNYAGSDILILRWIGMTPEAHYRGMAAVLDQNGKMYPYGRLLAHAGGFPGQAQSDAKECSWLTASYLKGAGFPLGSDPIRYDSDRLPDELLSHVTSGGVQVVFQGGMRAVGLVRGSGPDNALV